MVKPTVPGICEALQDITFPGKPRSEKEIEETAMKRLTGKGFPIRRQAPFPMGRLDLFSGGIVIEVKVTASSSCFKQLDKYSVLASGLVIVCWRATSDFKKIFQLTRSKIPLGLVELKPGAPMVA